ncbi:hypothetical protein SB757_35205, partial [Pseudomonas sp. SIMBA_065]
FNLSDWALKHQSFVWYLMFVALLMGVFSYMNLGREEDPSFTIKTMVIQTRWPGATQEETLSPTQAPSSASANKPKLN